MAFAYHPDAPLFDGLSWRIEEGDSWAVIGPSGCGKSTLLYLLAGLRLPNSGTILVDGSPITAPRPTTGLILQDYGLLPWIRASENVALGLRIRGAPSAQRREKVDQWIEHMGLSHVANHYPGELSGGQRQRMGIARTLAVEPTLLLMDEPFSSLDAFTREELQDLVVDLGLDKTLSSVLVTHNIEEAVFLGRRILVLGQPPILSGHVMENPQAREVGIASAPTSTTLAPTCGGWCMREDTMWRTERYSWLLALAGLLLTWEAVALAVRNEVLPTPVEVLPVLVRQAIRVELANHFLVSGYRVTVSVALAVGVAMPLGLLLGLNTRLNSITSPVVYLSYPIPKIVLLPVILLFLGIGDASKVSMIFLILFFQVLIVVRDAAQNVRPELVHSVRSLGPDRSISFDTSSSPPPYPPL